MVKSTIIAVMLLVAVLAGAQTPTANDFSRLSVRPLPHREVKTTVVSTEPRTFKSLYDYLMPIVIEKNNTDAFSTDVFSRRGITRAEKGKECVDSIIRINFADAPVSKQTFSYNAVGMPATCLSYLPGEEEDWTLYSRYSYEYDDQNRVIARESVNNTYHGEDYRYEYIYTDASLRYTTELFYMWNMEENEWTPFQQGEYAWDGNGNLLMQTFYSWSSEVSDWQPVQKKTYTWDGQNRQTSYFGYVWDTAANDWIGSIDDGDCEEYFYAENGDDSLIKKYLWVEGEWVNYQQTIYTYDANWNCTREESQYWNRERQDWSGNETWGPNGFIFQNQYADNQYDSADRLIRQDVYQTNTTGEYVLMQFITNEYKDLGSGNTEKSECLSIRWQDPEPTPYKEKIQRFNKWGSEYYYMSYSYQTGTRMPIEEEIRDIDEYNNHYGDEMYSFNSDGSRYGQLKSRNYYPSDYDPASRLQIPYETMIWLGVSRQTDNEWSPYSLTEYNWILGDIPVLTASRFYRYIDDVKVPATGFDDDYDPSVKMEDDILFWKDVNKSDTFYAYKINKITEYRNPDYDKGIAEWNLDRSYIDYYYYSEFNGSGVGNVALDSDAVEIARYDVSGIRLQSPVKGVNIICYSDGSVRKVIVR